MGTLRSALEEIVADDVGPRTEVELTEDLQELERASRVIEAERARRIAELERRGAQTRDGHLSMTAWLAYRLRISSRAAAGHVHLARALRNMPLAASALSDGSISVSSAILLSMARETDAEAFEQCEHTLVEAAKCLPVRDLARAIQSARALSDSKALEADARRRFQRRRLHVSPTLDGMIRLDGDLDPETGQVLIAALRSFVDAWARADPDDRRGPAQRRADALGEICRRYLDARDRPVVAGERPHVVVTMDLDSLEARAGRRCELDEAGAIGAEAARRLACDASVARVIVGPRSELLDIGRRSPVVPPGIRRALAVRDTACRFPGCEVRHTWCDAHHVEHWADGGATSTSNLVLLCRRHHRAVHDGFEATLAEGEVRFTRADGTPLERHPP